MKFAKWFLALAMLASVTVSAQTTTTRTVTWTAPVVDATHSEAVAYIVNWRSVGATAWTQVQPNPTTPSCVIEIPTGVAVEARVQGIDSAGNIGVWSLTSNPYTHKVPAACGKPSWL